MDPAQFVQKCQPVSGLSQHPARVHCFSGAAQHLFNDFLLKFTLSVEQVGNGPQTEFGGD